MTDYRLLQADEYPEAVELWTNVFRVERDFFTSLLDGGKAEDNISFAALENGQIVASVHVFMRQIRGRDGVPLKVGGIGSVSTHPDHRKKGHSGRLLEMALGAMESEGCVWSYLGTGVHDHYARYGWRTVSTTQNGGTVKTGLSGEAELLLPTEQTLQEMATVHDVYTATRPMATVRSEQAWRTAVRYRVDPARATIFGARENGRLVAYLVLGNSWGSWILSDAAALPGTEGRLAELFAATASHLEKEGASDVRSVLPGAPELAAGFASMVVEVIPGESRSEMARPIAGRISWPDLAALLADPAGRHSPLDAF